MRERYCNNKMWPYNPGGRWRRGRIRRGLLYVRQVAEYIKYLKISICTHQAVYSFIIIIHMIISAVGVFVNTFRLSDEIPWVSTLRCE